MRRRHLLSAGLIFFAFFTGTLCLFILSLGTPAGQALFAISSSGLHINNNFNWRQFRFNPDRNMYVRRREENTRAYLDFYYNDRMAGRNPFVEGKPRDPDAPVVEPYVGPVPAFDHVRTRLPAPFWAGHADAIDCYWTTWQIVRTRVRSCVCVCGRVRVR